MKTYGHLIIFLLLLQVQNVEAKFDCEFLHPKLQEKDININGNVKAEAKGFLSKILGAEGNLKGEYFDQDSLVKYPNADKLAKWYSIAYISCGMMNEDDISIEKKTEIYMKLMNIYAVLSGVEEKLINSKGLKDEFVPISIDLSNISVGRKAKNYGKNIIVKDFRGQKYLSGKNNNGYFFLDDIKVKENIDVQFVFKFHIQNQSKRIITLKTNKNKKIKVKFDEDYIYFSGVKKKYRTSFKRWSYWNTPYEPNSLRFEIYKDEIILFVNDSLVGSIDKEEDMVITSVSLSGLSEEDKLFAFTISEHQ